MLSTLWLALASFISLAAAQASNPYEGNPEIYLSPFYADEIDAALANLSDASLAEAAAAVKEIPTFIWFDQVAKVPTLGDYLSEASANGQTVQIVVYDVPDRDCGALASAGEFSIADGGEEQYRGYIDQIVEQISQYPDVTVIAVIEPDSLPNLVTNLSIEKCANAQDVYKRSVSYALQQLSTVGVYMYLDAGHAGWLGWPDRLAPAAQLVNEVYAEAGSPEFVRGLATDVSNYNAFSAAVPDPITEGNPNYDELHYVEALAPLLAPFPAHFIVDQGRSGVQNLRETRGQWCNVIGAGFGTRPTTDTGSELVDAIVWVKPGGESDGTSDTSSPRYDSSCSVATAMQPAPEAGSWFQAYFENVVRNAVPPLP